MEVSEINVLILAFGDAAAIHADALTRHAQAWCAKPNCPLETERGEMSRSALLSVVSLQRVDLVVLVTVGPSVLYTDLGREMLTACADRCLHLELGNVGGGATDDASVAPKPHLRVSGGSVLAPDCDGPCVFAGFGQALFTGLFTKGMVGVDWADFRQVFRGSWWQVLAGFGQACGEGRAALACDQAIAALECRAFDTTCYSAGFVVVGLPTDCAIWEFEHVADMFRRIAPAANFALAAPVLDDRTLEVALLAGQRVDDAST
ncbi:hypothetical protein [Halofilum ochraceum]|uniref:hypothetical protein n=1 Tax=Halofilum ochraceum TaxID=1611323 RepID=UPI0015864348|nr:hypothetical protein [Halofilum ochraceum]